MQSQSQNKKPMKNKDYRELQLSSSQLFFIFLAILILGVVIFLLGVSVGKKQAQIMRGTQITAKEKAGPAEDQTSPPAEESKESISKESASLQKPTEETQEQPAASDDRTLFYVQVGAFNRRDMAVTFAETFNYSMSRSVLLTEEIWLSPLPKHSIREAIQLLSLILFQQIEERYFA